MLSNENTKHCYQVWSLALSERRNEKIKDSPVPKRARCMRAGRPLPCCQSPKLDSVYPDSSCSLKAHNVFESCGKMCTTSSSPFESKTLCKRPWFGAGKQLTLAAAQGPGFKPLVTAWKRHKGKLQEWWSSVVIFFLLPLSFTFDQELWLLGMAEPQQQPQWQKQPTKQLASQATKIYYSGFYLLWAFSGTQSEFCVALHPRESKLPMKSAKKHQHQTEVTKLKPIPRKWKLSCYPNNRLHHTRLSF